MLEEKQSITLWPVMTQEEIKSLLDFEKDLTGTARFYIKAFYISDWTSHPRRDDIGRYWIDGKLYGRDPCGRIHPGKYVETVKSELTRLLFGIKKERLEEIFNKYFYFD